MNQVAKEELLRLIEGNMRFQQACLVDRSGELNFTRLSLAKEGQKPWAIVVGCSDSRVPVEKVFDSGLGELFVVRVAGNVADANVIASVEFAMTFWDIKLCVVLGHRSCGAVSQAFNPVGPSLSAHVDNLMQKIKFAAQHQIGPQGNPPDDMERIAKANSSYWQRHLMAVSPVVGQRVLDEKTLVAWAWYDTWTGLVHFDRKIIESYEVSAPKAAF